MVLITIQGVEWVVTEEWARRFATLVAAEEVSDECEDH